MAHEAPEWGECKRGGTYLYVPFNEEFIFDLKKAVPKHKREWSPDDQAWWVHDNYLDEVEDLLKEHFPDYEP